MATPSNTRLIKPSAWFVIKSKISGDNEHVKLFLNICTEAAIPPPPALSEEDLGRISAEGDTSDLSNYYIPVILSDVRSDKDKAGKSCKVVDCVVNPQLRAIVERIPEYRTLLIAIVLDQADSHLGLNLSRDIVIPNIQSKGKPIVQLIELPAPRATTISTIPTPIRETPRHKEDVVTSSAGSFLNITISVPKLTRTIHSNATLDIESRRVLLECGQVYTLDLTIDSALAPKGIEIEKSVAEWRVKDAQLIIRAPLVK